MERFGDKFEGVLDCNRDDFIYNEGVTPERYLFDE